MTDIGYTAAEYVGAGVAFASAVCAVIAFLYGTWVGVVRFVRNAEIRVSAQAWCKACGEDTDLTEYHDGHISVSGYKVHYCLMHCETCGELSFYVYAVSRDDMHDTAEFEPPDDVNDIPF